MAGGYAEDRWVQGGSDATYYHLRHWRCLDAFVYFSHRLVTIPPPGWVNAAHTHGVPVLGTLFGSEDYLQDRSELVAILLPASAPPDNPMQRLAHTSPRGPAPPPRNWVSPEDERRLKTSPEWPWNAL